MPQEINDFSHIFLMVFIPLFVAIDALGVLPVFISMTTGLNQKERNRLVTQATLTGLAIAVVFLFTGKFIFRFLGISENDFRIAGGLILLLISIGDIVTGTGPKRKHDTFAGVVPIGVPLIVGPAALTTLLIIVDSYGFIWAVSGLVLNLAIVWISFRKSHLLLRVLGESGSRAFGKIMALFLAAIAVMMIRVGLVNSFHLKG